MEKLIIEDGIDFNSSNVKSAKYNPDICHLAVTFKFGNQQEYIFCVKDDHIWEELLLAKSKGKFISRKLKGKTIYNIYKNCRHTNL